MTHPLQSLRLIFKFELRQGRHILSLCLEWEIFFILRIYRFALFLYLNLLICLSTVNLVWGKSILWMYVIILDQQ